jgi:hypothetical protein
MTEKINWLPWAEFWGVIQTGTKTKSQLIEYGINKKE